MLNSSPPDALPSAVFRARREAALDALGEGVLVLPAAPLSMRSRDTEYPYRPSSELYYLTGATEAETVAVLIGGAEPRCELFVRPRDELAELWTGPRLGPEAATERLGIETCHPTNELEERLPGLLQEARSIGYRPRGDARLDRLVEDAFRTARARGARLGTGPRTRFDPGEILDELRLRKDEFEIERIRTAAAISASGHRAAAGRIGPGVGEWEVQAEIEAAFRAAGAIGPGFGTIVGAGANACVLHYVDNHDRIGDDGLVLVDAGAEYGLYQGDISRTFPASGRFGEAERRVYDLVDQARGAAIAAVRPGETIAGVHAAAVRVIVEGLREWGVVSGRIEDLLAEEAHRDFFPHQTSHWLGIDVHDPGDYARDGRSRVLEPGMVFTVEPGLYFRPDFGGQAAAPLAGIGVRIEDDVLVTATGAENLTAALPTGSAEIESLMERMR